MRLTDVCGIQMGYTLRGRVEPIASGGVRVIQMGDFSSDGRIEPDALARLPLEKSVDRYLVGAGDVLFRSRGERNTATALGDEFGESALAASPLIVLRPKKAKVEPAYLAWVLNQRPAQSHFDSWARGTRLRMVPKASLDELEIDLPDIATQRLIVEVERLASRERQLVTTGAEKRKALIDRILQVRAGQNKTGNKIKGRMAS